MPTFRTKDGKTVTFKAKGEKRASTRASHSGGSAMTKKGGGGRRSGSRSQRRPAHRRKTLTGMLRSAGRTVVQVAKVALPVAMITGGALLPLTSTQGTGYSAISALKPGQNLGVDTAAFDFAYNLQGNLTAEIVPAATLIVGGVVAHKVLGAVRI